VAAVAAIGGIGAGFVDPPDPDPVPVSPDADLIAWATDEYDVQCGIDDQPDTAAGRRRRAITARQDQLREAIISRPAVTLYGYRAKALAVLWYIGDGDAAADHPVHDEDWLAFSLAADLLGRAPA
jgi:hypothetical protein